MRRSVRLAGLVLLLVLASTISVWAQHLAVWGAAKAVRGRQATGDVAVPAATAGGRRALGPPVMDGRETTGRTANEKATAVTQLGDVDHNSNTHGPAAAVGSGAAVRGSGGWEGPSEGEGSDGAHYASAGPPREAGGIAVAATAPPKDYVGCVHVDASRRAADADPRMLPADAEEIRRVVDAVAARPGRGNAHPVVVLTWTACHGALSQHYGHLSALAIARRIRPDVIVLPHARTRDSFSHRNNAKQELNTVAWVELDLEEVYRTASFYDVFRRGGDAGVNRGGHAHNDPRTDDLLWPVTIFRHPVPPGNVTLPSSFRGYEKHYTANATAKYGLPAGTPVVGVKYHRRRMGWAWEEIINRRVQREKGQASVVLVDLGCTDVMVSANVEKGCDPEDVARMRAAHLRLRLQVHLTRAGEALASKMRGLAARRASAHPGRGHGGDYIGLHMRIERDMHSSVAREKRWEKEYERTLPAFLNKHDLPILIASGVFEYASAAELAGIFRVYRGHLLRRACVAPRLPNDVAPWVDFIGLYQSAVFEGHENSAFTWLIVEHRSMERRPLNTSNLVVVPHGPRANRTYIHPPTCCANNRCLALTCYAGDGRAVDAIDARKRVMRRFDEGWLTEHLAE